MGAKRTAGERMERHVNQGTPARDGQAERRTIGVIGLALLLRVLVLLAWARPHGARILFQKFLEMSLLAQSVLHGQGLSSPFGPPTGPTAFVAPVYPILVAGIFKLFGVETNASAWAILALQVVTNLVTIWLLIALSRRLFNERTAMVAGIFWACSPPLLFLPTIFWETSFTICLLLGSIAFALRLRDGANIGLWAGFGAYCGLAALVNPALLLSLIGIGVWTVGVNWRARTLQLQYLAASVLLFLVVFSPWPIRNARAFHAFIPLRTTVGFELWMGNHAGSNGYLDESLFPMFNPSELAEYQAQGEVAYTDGKTLLGKQYIEAHPFAFAGLTACRFVRYWGGTGTRNGSPVFEWHSVLTTSFGLAGLVLLYSRGRWWIATLLATPLLLFPIPYYVTHAEFRYRVAIDPIVTLLGAYAVATYFRRSKQGAV